MRSSLSVLRRICDAFANLQSGVSLYTVFGQMLWLELITIAEVASLFVRHICPYPIHQLPCRYSAVERSVRKLVAAGVAQIGPKLVQLPFQLAQHLTTVHKRKDLWLPGKFDDPVCHVSAFS